MMTDNDLRYLYQQAYCAKEAGALDDFINWLRQLFGMSRKNTTGENIAATGAGIGATGALGYGGYKGYQKLRDLEKATNYFARERNFKPFVRKQLDLALSGPQGDAIRTDPELWKKTEKAGQDLFRGRQALAKTKYAKNFTKGMGFLRRLPKGGKWAILGGLAAGGGALAGKAYDSIFNG